MLGLKIDVDTARGTAIGTPWLSRVLKERNIQATFLFSLGKDQTGRALFRIFRPGFFQKAQRTNALKIYGLRTLLNGLLLPGPHIGQKYGDVMKRVQDDGHEVGIHCYSHILWQDHLHKLPESRIREEVSKAQKEFKRIFGCFAKTMGAAGWQANQKSLSAYDDQNFLYASDMRGVEPFFPRAGQRVFKTLQIPTTLPTLDEILGVVPDEEMTSYYLNNLKSFNVFTLHAELEGMYYKDWFVDFLEAIDANMITIMPLEKIAKSYLSARHIIPVKEIMMKEIPGRSGTVACSA